MIQYYNQYHLKEARHVHSPTTGVRQGDPLEFFKFYCVNNSTFFTISSHDAEKSTSLIVEHFRQSGLKIHFGIRSAGKASKTEAMIIPGLHQGYKKYSEIHSDLVTDIDLDSDFPERSHISFVEFFKYLGLFISWDLRETVDVSERIKAATKFFGAVQNNFYGNTDIPLHLQIQWFKVIAVNVLLWGCEIWALTYSEVKKIKVFYCRCLRYMLKITDFHQFWNNDLLKLVGVDDVILAMRLRQFQWLDKLAHMPRIRIPRQLFGGWVLDMSKNSNQLRARPFQTIAHCHNVTLGALGVSKDDAKFIQSMTGIIKQSEEWAKRVEENLGLKEGAYKQYKMPGGGNDTTEIANDPMLPVLNPPRVRSRNGRQIFAPDWYVPT